MLFKDYLAANATILKSYMKWDNYELNTTILPVVEAVENDALEVLSNVYGKFEVEDILDELKADVLMNFPTLLQQLSITMVMTAENVVQKDVLSETMTRKETGVRDTSQTTDMTLDTQVTELNTIDNTSTTTGTSKDTGTSKTATSTVTTQTNETEILNTSGVEMTGSRNVNINNAMPEQSISGVTEAFPVDTEGTPILSTSTVQSATQSFSTVNPIDSSETSSQSINVTANNTGESLTTNDLTNTQNIAVSDVGTTNRTTANTGTDTTLNTALENTDNEVTETTTREATNPQYAYEIRAFLESVQSINAFKVWANNFAWVCGIL